MSYFVAGLLNSNTNPKVIINFNTIFLTLCGLARYIILFFLNQTCNILLRRRIDKDDDVDDEEENTRTTLNT